MKSREKIEREIELANDYLEEIKMMFEIGQVTCEDYKRSKHIVQGSIHSLEWVLKEDK